MLKSCAQPSDRKETSILSADKHMKKQYENINKGV